MKNYWDEVFDELRTELFRTMGKRNPRFWDVQALLDNIMISKHEHRPPVLAPDNTTLKVGFIWRNQGFNLIVSVPNPPKNYCMIGQI